MKPSIMLDIIASMRQRLMATELAQELELLNLQLLPRNTCAKTPDDRASELVAQLQQMDFDRQAAIADAVTQLSRTLDWPVNKTVQLFAARSLRAMLYQSLLVKESSPHTSPMQPTTAGAMAQSADLSSVAPMASAANPATVEPAPDAQTAIASMPHDANETADRCANKNPTVQPVILPAKSTPVSVDQLLGLIEHLTHEDSVKHLIAAYHLALCPSQTGEIYPSKIAG